MSRSEATLAQMFWNRMEASAPLPAQMVKHGGEWRTGTWAEVGDIVRELALGLLALGTRPGDAVDNPEPDYGWIELGHAIGTPGAERVSRIRRFWEKPSPALAEELWTRGCLWNSFVMIGSVPTSLSLMRQALPDLWDAFAAVGPAIGTPREDEVIRELYATLAPVNFSREVLATRPANLGVLRVTGVDWCDWGAPDRVLATLTRRGIQPDCATAVAEPA